MPITARSPFAPETPRAPWDTRLQDERDQEAALEEAERSGDYSRLPGPAPVESIPDVSSGIVDNGFTAYAGPAPVEDDVWSGAEAPGAGISVAEAPAPSVLGGHHVAPEEPQAPWRDDMGSFHAANPNPPFDSIRGGPTMASPLSGSQRIQDNFADYLDREGVHPDIASNYRRDRFRFAPTGGPLGTASSDGHLVIDDPRGGNAHIGQHEGGHRYDQERGLAQSPDFIKAVHEIATGMVASPFQSYFAFLVGRPEPDYAHAFTTPFDFRVKIEELPPNLQPFYRDKDGKSLLPDTPETRAFRGEHRMEPEARNYRMDAIADRLEPAEQGPVRLPNPNELLDRATAGARGVTELAQVAAQTTAGAGAALGLGVSLTGRKRMMAEAQSQIARRAEAQGGSPEAWLHAARDYQITRPAEEQFINEMLMDPLNLVGLGAERAVADAVSDAVRGVRRAGTRALESEAGQRLIGLGDAELGEMRFPGGGAPEPGALEAALQARGVRGDRLLNTMDLADELNEVGAEIGPDGLVTLYHRTSPDAAEAIVKTGRMTGKEDRLFFGTHPEGEIEGYGDAVVKVRLPLERLELNDVFGHEAHVTLKGQAARVQAERWSPAVTAPEQIAPTAQELTPPAAQNVSSTPTVHGVPTDTPNVYWHGSPSGDLRGGAYGLHVGTFKAAEQALTARIGHPVEGTWDGTRAYGETMLAGQRTLRERGIHITGYNVDAPVEDFFPTSMPTFGDRTPMAADMKPNIEPVRITGGMTNTPSKPHEDFRANGLMAGQIKRGAAKRGYFYEQVGEDAGSISAVVPSGSHLERISVKADAPTGTSVPPPDYEASVLADIAAQKPRQFAESVAAGPNTNPAVAEGIRANPANYYDPTSNEASLKAAQELIATDRNAARASVTNAADAPDAVTSATGQLLINEAQAAGAWDEALDLTEKMAARYTEAGQFVQAASMYGRLTPEGIGRFAQRVVRQAQDSGIHNAKLTPEKLQDLVKQAETLQALPEGRAKALGTSELLRNVAELVPPTFWRKVATIQTIAQLLNPKTFIRNLGGNALFAGFENASRIVATPMDMLTSLATGKRSVTLPSASAQAGGFARGAREGFEEARRGVNTKSMPGQFDMPQQRVFGNTPVLSQLETATNLALRTPDRAFYEAAYDDSLLMQARVIAMNEGWKGKAAGTRVTELLAKPTAEMEKAAHMDGLFRTFQDENAAVAIFQLAKDVGNVVGMGRKHPGAKDLSRFVGEFGLGDMLIKYPRTPANLLMRAIDYSPVGYMKSLAQIGGQLFGRKFNQKAFSETMARATVGTAGLTATGYALSNLGLITGRSSPDIDVRAQERQQGIGQFKANVSGITRYLLGGFDPEQAIRRNGDTFVSYDWAQPLSVSLALGAQAAKPEVKKPRVGAPKGESIFGEISDRAWEGLGAAGEVAAVGLDTLANQPLVSQVVRFFGGQSLADSVVNVLKEMPASFVPTILNQLNQVFDNQMRERYTGRARGTMDDVTEGALNSVLAKIPVLAASMPASVDTWGSPEDRYHSDTNNPFNVFVNPAFISQYLPKPEAEMVLDLQQQTGMVTQFPREVAKYITVKGVPYDLTTEQFLDYQRIVGEKTRTAFTALAASERFRSADPNEQVEYLAKIVTELGEQARNELRARAQEAGGAVTALPPPEPKKPSTRMSLNETNVVENWKAQPILKQWDDLDTNLLASNPAWAAMEERIKATPTNSKEHKDALASMTHKSYNAALEKEKAKMWANPEAAKALMDWRGLSKPKPSTSGGGWGAGGW